MFNVHAQIEWKSEYLKKKSIIKSITQISECLLLLLASFYGQTISTIYSTHCQTIVNLRLLCCPKTLAPSSNRLGLIWWIPFLFHRSFAVIQSSPS